MKIVMISDTHGMHDLLNMPSGDVLIHAGDFSPRGTLQDVSDFNEWLGEQDYQHKIVIAGNHEVCLEQHPEEAEKLITHAIYLKDSSVVIDGLKFYGSPWQPWFFNWAFNLQRGDEIKEKWDLIDDDTDVLITHGPPHGYLDKTLEGEHVGCEELIKAVHRIKPKLHICGHIHGGYGVDQMGPTLLVNASTCNEHYDPINEPIVIDVKDWSS
ncbi:MAG: metallophosphatase domain-containing protein [Sneathiella sp.]|nr:metallophosphatase domain-containing protein [Sneathiella sp.]